MQQSPGCCGCGGGLTYQWLKYLSKYFSHSIGNRSMAGFYRSEGVSSSWILGEPIRIGGATTCGEHVILSNLRNIGKFNLCHIRDRVLLTTPGLKIHNLPGIHKLSGTLSLPNLTPHTIKPTQHLHIIKPTEHPHAIFHKFYQN